MNYSPVPMPPVADPNRQQNQFITPMPPQVQPTLTSAIPPRMPPLAPPINQDVAPIAPRFSAIPLNPSAPSQNQGLAQWMSNYMQHTGFHGPTGMPVFTHGGKHYIPQVAVNHGGFEEPALPTNPGPHNELGLDPGGAGYPSGTLPPSGSEPPPDGTGSNDYGPGPTPTPPPNGAWTDPNGNVWNPGTHQYIAPSGQITINPGDNSNDPTQPWESQTPDPIGIGGEPYTPPTGHIGGYFSDDPNAPGGINLNVDYNPSTGRQYGQGFLRNFGSDAQMRDPVKFGQNTGGDAGRSVYSVYANQGRLSHMPSNGTPSPAMIQALRRLSGAR